MSLSKNEQNEPVTGEARENIVQAVGELRVLARRLDQIRGMVLGLEDEWVRSLAVPRMVAADITEALPERYAEIMVALERAILR